MVKATQVRDLDAPKTHRFRKVIVSEGRYKTSNPDGTATIKEVSAEKLAKIATTFSVMKKRGLKVPAPWKHDFRITAFETGTNGLLTDSSTNAGFWDKLTLEVVDGKKTLVGEIEVPGDLKDYNSPAGKLGTSVKDTSIYMREQYQLPDGNNEILENVPMHIALVTHPIESGQSNFERLPDDSYSIAMSELVMEEMQLTNGGDSLTELSDLLRKVAKIYLPASTVMETLVRDLTIALTQMSLGEEEEGSEGTSNGRFEMEPLIMSKLTQAQIDAIVATKAVNPATGKPFTGAELIADTPEAPAVNADLERQNLVMSAMQSAMQEDRRTAYRARINTLVETRRCPKEVADAQLFPQADAYTLQFQNGQIAPSPLEVVLMSLEAMPAPVKAADPELGGLQADFYQDPGDMSEADMDALADSMLSYLG